MLPMATNKEAPTCDVNPLKEIFFSSASRCEAAPSIAPLTFPFTKLPLSEERSQDRFFFREMQLPATPSSRSPSADIHIPGI